MQMQAVCGSGIGQSPHTHASASSALLLHSFNTSVNEQKRVKLWVYPCHLLKGTSLQTVKVKYAAYCDAEQAIMHSAYSDAVRYTQSGSTPLATPGRIRRLECPASALVWSSVPPSTQMAPIAVHNYTGTHLLYS